MAPIARPKFPPSSRVECCGPHGGEPLIVSLITARAEDWIIYAKETLFPDTLHTRRHFLGWCRACNEAFKVTKP